MDRSIMPIVTDDSWKEGFAGDGKTCGDDADMDGVPDADLDCKGDKCKKDNCPDVPNSEQEDQDKDDLGDM